MAAHRQAFVENAAYGVRNGTANTPFAGQGGRLDFGGALQSARARNPNSALLKHELDFQRVQISKSPTARARWYGRRF